MAANKYRGEVAFPAQYYGEGVTLRFRTADCVALETEFGQEYQQAVLASLEGSRRFTVLVACLKHGLKRADGTAFPLMPKDCEDLPFAHDDVAPLIVDALCYAWYGKSGEDAKRYLEELRREVEKRMNDLGRLETLDDDEDDKARPTSSDSSTPPPAQDSLTTLSGD